MRRITVLGAVAVALILPTSAKAATSRTYDFCGGVYSGYTGFAFCASVIVSVAPSAYTAGGYTVTLNGLALPTLGAYLTLSAAVARNEQLIARIIGSALLVLAVGLLVFVFIYFTVVPLALKAVAENEQLTSGIEKAVVKAVMLFITYTTLFVAGGVQGWRRGRRA